MRDSFNWSYPGARWWKMDFHTHTPASIDTSAWQNANGTPDEVTPERWLLRFMEAEIDCVAITDHNTGAWIDRVLEAYERMKSNRPEGFRELHIFPGVEITVYGGFHLLAIFDKNTTTSDIDRLLGEVGYDGTRGLSDGVTRKSAIEVIQAVLEAGGIPIPAHADQEKGLFRAIQDANTLRKVLTSSDILAVEIVDRTSPKPVLYDELGLRWTEVLGSDCHSFQGSKRPGSHYTWVKMGDVPSLEGLRLALLDGEGYSIRRSDDPLPFNPFSVPEHFVEAIEISNARYMGRGQPEVLRFSPWFNALVGGRGTGKSTVVNFMRLAYRREEDLAKLGVEEEVRRTFERFNRVAHSRFDEGALLKNTHVVVTVMRDGVRHRLHWRQDDLETIVEEETNGQSRPSTSQAVTPGRFPVRIFSQGQIVALAGESQEALLAIIDEAAGTDEEKRQLDEARRGFLALCAEVRDLNNRLTLRDKISVKLEDVRRKLTRFEEANHAKILREYQQRMRQQREIERHIETVKQMAKRIESVTTELTLGNLPQDTFDFQKREDVEAVEILKQLANAVRTAAAKLQETAQGLRAAAQEAQEACQQSGWWTAVQQAQRAYNQLIEGLREQGISDPSEYGRLVQECRSLEEELEGLNSLEKQLEEATQALKEQYREVRSARRQISKKRQQFLTETLADNPHVRITLRPYGRDPRAIERSLREVLNITDDRFEDDILVMAGGKPQKGIVADLVHNLPGDVNEATEEMEERIENLKECIEKACTGQGVFGARFNSYLKRTYERSPEFLDRILTWFPEDALDIEYSPKGDGREFRSIGQASAGQRAAAMLAFLLAHGSEPLVLDQPEDDLDNALIYDLVVRQIRENKLRRQLIIVTHNPNIVVNGDAEMVHVLDFRAGQCRVVRSGSLQEREVREDICRTMEGGREAFERRWRRIGQVIPGSTRTTR